MDLTTVADDEAVVHDGLTVRHYTELDPDTTYTYDGVTFRTLPRPGGELLGRFATVNDVHFGEVECGYIEGMEMGPILASGPDEEPYPETMNRAAVLEIGACDPAYVVAKGDLTANGTVEEYQRFEAVYRGAFGDRLVEVRGNHDGAHGERFAEIPYQQVKVGPVRLAVIDTTIDGHHSGQLTDQQLQWLEWVASDTDDHILVFGHHHPWSPDSNTRESGYFGINPDDSERLVGVFTRHPNLIGYFAGHTHRNRVRRFSATGEVPWVEVACVKDFPGAWAEYRVYEGGVMQVHRRISTPEALAWTDRTRAMFGGLYPSYAFGDLEDRCFVISRPA